MRAADRLDGGEGNDVFGTAGRDQLLGGDGDDVIAGHHDADRLVRGPGDDALVDAGEGVDGLRGMRIVSLPSPPGTEGQGDTCSTATGRRTPARAGQGRTSA